MSLANIREFLSYDPETGVFTRIKARRCGAGKGCQVGDRAGWTHKDGRSYINFDNKNYRSSRLAWFFVNGIMPPPEIQIDHKNRDVGDDRIENLRICSQAQNLLNKRRHRRRLKDSGYKGVRWHGQRNIWTVAFRGKYLGIFTDPIEAARVYDAAAFAHDPEFALLNFQNGAG